MDQASSSPYDPSLLLRFGDDPEAVSVCMQRELDAFEALWPDLQPCWTMPLPGGAWSPAQVVEHVLKASISFSKVIHLLRRDAPLPDLPRVAGEVVNGKAQAPAMIRPGDPKPLRELEPAWREMRSRLLKEVTATSDWHGRTFFHPFFGDQDALGWLRVTAWHPWHHRRGLEGTRGHGV